MGIRRGSCVTTLSEPILKKHLRNNAGSLVLLTCARKNALALRLGYQLRNGWGSKFTSAFTTYHLRHPHSPPRLPRSSSPAYNRLRIQLMSDFASVGTMVFTGTTSGNVFRCYHEHQAHYREPSSFLRLPDLPEVAAFGETSREVFRHSIDATVSLVVSSTAMDRWKRHEQWLTNGHKEM